MAITINNFSDKTTFEHSISRISAAQQKFSNSFSLNTSISDDDWEELQLHVPAGRMRLLRCDASSSSIVDIIASLWNKMSDKNSLKLQNSYFDDMKSQLISSLTTKTFLFDALSTLTIPVSASELLCEGLPSLTLILKAEIHELEDYCPIDHHSIKLIHSFLS